MHYSGEAGRKMYPYTTDTPISELRLVANGQASVITLAAAVKGIMTLSGPVDRDQYTSVWRNSSNGGTMNQPSQQATPQKAGQCQMKHLQWQWGRKQICLLHQFQWRIQTGRSSLLVKSVSHVNRPLIWSGCMTWRMAGTSEAHLCRSLESKKFQLCNRQCTPDCEMQPN